MGIIWSRLTCNSSEQDYVNRVRRQNCVAVFSKSTCPYCTDVKKKLDDSQIGYKAIDIDQRGDEDSVQLYLYKLTGASTVPRVFVNGVSIGGNDETTALLNSGELKSLVNKCSVFPCIVRQFFKNVGTQHADATVD